MKRIRFVFAMLVAAATFEPAWALKIGDPLAEKAVRMKTADGKDVSIGDVAGKKGTLVLFTCNACPWVKAWETRIAQLGNEYSKQGVGVIAVNSNDPSVVREDGFEVMQQRAKEKGFEFPYAVDEGSKLARAYGAERTPEAFLFDAEGKLVYHGTIDETPKSRRTSRTATCATRSKPWSTGSRFRRKRPSRSAARSNSIRRADPSSIRPTSRAGGISDTSASPTPSRGARTNPSPIDGSSRSRARPARPIRRRGRSASGERRRRGPRC